MRTERLDIRVNRNADYFETWQILDYASEPIDLTSCTLVMNVRLVAGMGSVITSAVITKSEPENGYINVRIDGSSFTSLPILSQVERLSYDLKVIYPDGVEVVPVSGLIILTPGVTY